MRVAFPSFQQGYPQRKEDKEKRKSCRQCNNRDRCGLSESRIKEPINVLGANVFATKIHHGHGPRKGYINHPHEKGHGKMGKHYGWASQQRCLRQNRNAVEIMLELVAKAGQIVGFSALDGFRPDGVLDNRRDENRKGCAQFPQDQCSPKDPWILQDRICPFWCRFGFSCHLVGRKGDGSPAQETDSKQKPAPRREWTHGSDSFEWYMDPS
mmetsp:Transcript_21350/g.43927  ORF Transcript_21350/g.43927 Transcript_21350/m.43927 type:complete len:211 (-) Transcript_21350:377-1009(-)